MGGGGTCNRFKVYRKFPFIKSALCEHLKALQMTFRVIRAWGRCAPHHFAVVGIVKALQQLHAGAFPTAAAADKGQRLSGFHRHGQPVQDLDVGPGGVRELAVNEVNVSLEMILIEEKNIHINDRHGRSQGIW